MTLSAVLALFTLLASPAWADGGKGGAGYGGVGGTTSATGVGGDGGYGGNSDGGGGGGAGITGGAGGSGGSRFGGDPGGAGGALPGASGSPGSTNPPYSSATGGGGGGAHGGMGAGLPVSAVSGGNGGDGAIGFANVGGGGGGGAGGWGWVVTGGGDLGVLGAAVTGGNGGGGANVPGFGGNGGDGGVGLYFDTAGATATINAAVTGGNAGAAGVGYSIGGSAGAGGAGIVGNDLALTIAGAGSVTGGSGGGNAITFGGGANVLALQSGAVLSGNIAVNGGGTLNIAPAVAYTLSSGITGDGSVTKTGAQTLTLTGASNYTASTAVSAGKLLVDGSISSSSLVTVNSGAALGGIGSVGNSVTVSSGGIVYPGDVAGDFATLNTGALSIHGTAEFDVGASTADRIASSGAVDLSGAALTLNLIAAPAWATQFTLLSTTGTLSGTFDGLPDGMLFNVAGTDFVIHYTTTAVVIVAGTPPAVTSLLPASGAEAGGMSVTISGSNFTGATAVAFGGAAATSFVVDSMTQITAITPSGTGTVDVTVTTPIGTSATSRADQYTYFVPSLVVNSLADGLPAVPINCAVGNANTCRLRDAVAAALAGDTITFAVDGTITLSGNTTLMLAQSVTIDGSGHTITVDGNDAATVFAVNTGVVANIGNLVIQHGSSLLDGGGIANHGTLTLSDSSVLNNMTANGPGGGIYSDGEALTLIRVTVSNNQGGGGGGEGAGIYSAGGTLTLSDSLVSSNAAVHAGGGIYIAGGSARVTGTTISGNTTENGAGGGIYNSGTLTAINSTLAGNSVGGGGGNGGGIYNSGSPYDSAVGKATLINVTVAGNASVHDGVEIYNWGTFALTNSIVDRLAASGIACGNGGAHTLTDNGGNLDSDGTCGFSAVNNSKPNATLDLGALASINGSLPVMLPASDSDAIDFGLDSACSDAATVGGVDARGAPRPLGAHCDAGAVEVLQYPLTINVSGNGSVTSQTPAVPATSNGIVACSAIGGTCSAYYFAGTQITLALAPAAGSHLGSVIVAAGDCGGSLTAGASPYTTAALTGACTLNVVFASDVHFAVSAPSTATAGSAFGFTVTALDTANNPLTSYDGTAHFASSDAGAVLPADAVLSGGVGTFQATLSTVGNQTITATDTANASIAGTSGQIHVVGTQTITFPAQGAQAYVNSGTFAINPLATTDGDSSIAYSSKTPAVCMVSGTTVTIVSAGTCTIAANTSASPSGNYMAAPEATQNVAIGLAAQTITFPDPGAQTLTSGTFAVAASTDSALQIVFTTTTGGVCSIGSTSFLGLTTTATVTMLTAGTCTITASQAGDGNHAAAAPVTRNVQIAKKSTTVTLSGPTSTQQGQSTPIAATVAGDPPSGTVLFCDGALNGNACAGTVLCAAVQLVAGTSSSTATCPATFTTAGTHSISAYYIGDASFQPAVTAAPFVVTVAAAPPSAAVPAPALGFWSLLLIGVLFAGFASASIGRNGGR